MSCFLNQVTEALIKGRCPNIHFDNDTDYQPFDQYVDKLLENKLIIKNSEYDFMGVGWADLVNSKLHQLESAYLLRAVHCTDNKLDMKVKGQAVYFIITKDGNDWKSLIFTWSWDPFHVFNLAQ